MNRETILASVHRQLRDSFAETGESRPLGEIVPRVAEEIRSPVDVAGTTWRGVIPMEKVAAFVDGQLETEESDEICAAVMVDNSVLAEIIAAVRAKTTTNQLAPLSSSLTTRLMAMKPSRGLDATMFAPSLPPEASQELSPVPGPPDHIARGDWREREGRRNSIWHAVAAVAAIAAILIGVMTLIGRDDESDAPVDRIARDRSAANSLRPEQVVVPESIPSETVPATPESGTDRIVTLEPSTTSDPGTVTNPGDSLIPLESVAESVPEIEDRPTPVRAAPSSIAGADSALAEPMPPPPDDMNPLEDPTPIRITAQQDEPVDVRWTEVTGLLAQRVGTESAATSSASDTVADASPHRGPMWKSVRAGSPSSSQATSELTIRTLPFSRAKGEFAKVGQIVVAADTGLQIDPGDDEFEATLVLMHGSVALIDVRDGTAIRVRHGGNQLTKIRWQKKASAVLQRFGTELQVQVEKGEVKVNETPVKEASVRVSADQTVAEVRGPRRLPRWVTRSEDSTPSERLILAQMSESGDLKSSLNQQIRAMLVSSSTIRRDDQRTLLRLARWRAALAGPGIYQLAGNRIPVIRQAALQHLATLPETDPRYEPTWNTVNRMVNNQQRIAQLQNWFRLIRAGRSPNAAQMEHMLAGLANRDYAGRALCDFMLRQYVRNPPPFDPSWTGPTLQRAIKVYRERAGLPDVRLRSNATSAAGARQPSSAR